MNFRPLPLSSSLDEYKRQAHELFEALVAGDEEAMEFIRQHHPVLQQLPFHEFMGSALTPEHARMALARGYHFEDWDRLAAWVENMMDKNSEIFIFENAVDLMVGGNIEELEKLIRAHPQLVRTRSTRSHHAMLIHYIGANGVEDYRQQSPQNAVEILRMLLNAGSELDPLADMYGGSTPFGLVATSIWPAKAGVLIPLLETFLEAGASINHPNAAGNIQNAVIGCLHNGRPEAAQFLARKGAELDLEGAAGVGRLDLVKSFFDAEGLLKNGATRHQLEYGFAWACEYGQKQVVEFLLDKGISPEQQVEGLSGFHWAIVGGRQDIVKLFLDRKVSLEERNGYGGTALGCALWATVNSDRTYRWPEPGDPTIPIIEELLKAGAPLEPGIIQWIWDQKALTRAQKEKIEKLLILYAT